MEKSHDFSATDKDNQKLIINLVREADRLEGENRYDLALEIYEKVLDLLPKPIEKALDAGWALDSAAKCNIKLGKLDEAKAQLETSLKCYKGELSPSSHHLLGQISYEQGDMDKAKEHFLIAHKHGEATFATGDKKYLDFITPFLPKEGGGAGRSFAARLYKGEVAAKEASRKK